jgi:TPR repeat protein
MEMNIPQLRERAEFGSSVAETTLGICYLYGIDVEVDCREAFRLLSTAAGKGVPRAAVNLARMYAEGPGEKGRKGVRRIFYRIAMKPSAPASGNQRRFAFVANRSRQEQHLNKNASPFRPRPKGMAASTSSGRRRW